MTDTKAFRMALIEAGLTNRDVAKRLGITDAALYNKTHNISEFRASELAKLYELLGLDTLDKQQRIFFARDVESESTLTA